MKLDDTLIFKMLFADSLIMIAVEFESFEMNKKLIDALIDSSAGSAGVFTDWFLFAANCLRIVPPLTISTDEIKKACQIILAGLNKI